MLGVSMQEIDKLHNIITQSQNIVFLTGAGASTPSGITDFETIYSQKFIGFDTIDIMTGGFIQKHPDVFLQFVKKYFAGKTSPNICHKYIASLQQHKTVTVITQNIDNLHQEAGSKKVIELHGTFQKWRCTSCGHTFTFDEVLDGDSLLCPIDFGIIRPDAVFYNENIPTLKILDAQARLRNADTLVVVGTSLQTQLPVYLISQFEGKNLVVINKNHVQLDKPITLEINQDIAKVFTELERLSSEHQNSINK